MRQYYGSGSMILGGGMTRTIKTLMIINVAVFLLQIASGWKLNEFLGLCSDKYIRGKDHLFPVFLIWQIFTYMFLHGGVLHLAFNMFLLWMFGRELESLWGEKAFLRYYLICGVGAGVVTYFFTLGSSVITIGASGAVFGVLVAYAVIYPEQLITLLLFFIIPITLKAKHLVMIFAGIELLHCISGTNDGVGHFAHVGGAAVGYLYLKMWRKASFYDVGSRENLLSRFTEPFRRWKQYRAEVLEKEVDRILGKISKQGIESLTRREKIILRRRSRK